MPLAGAIIGEVEETIAEIKRGYVPERERDTSANDWNVSAGLPVPRKSMECCGPPCNSLTGTGYL